MLCLWRAGLQCSWVFVLSNIRLHHSSRISRGLNGSSSIRVGSNSSSSSDPDKRLKILSFTSQHAQQQGQGQHSTRVASSCVASWASKNKGSFCSSWSEGRCTASSAVSGRQTLSSMAEFMPWMLMTLYMKHQWSTLLLDLVSAVVLSNSAYYN